jgi:hypothetical protein
MIPLFLALTLHLHAKDPFVVEQHKTDHGVQMVIENPRLHRAKVIIHCGGSAEYNETALTLDPRTRTTVDIETEPPADFCSMRTND